MITTTNDNISPSRPDPVLNKKWILAALLCILGIAVFFRFWQLGDIPPGLYPDEAINANQGWQAIQSGSFPLFYPDNHGREGLYINLVGVSLSVFGISIAAFKLVSATAGALTVFGLYLFTKEFFAYIQKRIPRASFVVLHPPLIALLSSFFLATSFWHINFSRIGFRAILTPLVLTFSFYFLFRGLQTKRFRDFIFSGLLFGVGFHTYISFRLAVLVIAFSALFWLLVALREHWTKRYLALSVAFFLAIFIVGLPIGLYFLDNPEFFISRATGVSVFSQEQPILAFLQSLGQHLGMFNIQGDGNWRHNIASAPQLSLVVGLFFLVGFFYALASGGIAAKRVVANASQRTQALAELGSYKFLFVWFFALMLPGALTFEGLPHALRVIGIIPPVFVFAGLGAYLVLQLGYKFVSKTRNSLALYGILIAGLLVGILWNSYQTYFVAWGTNPQVEAAFTKRFVDVGRQINTIPPQNPVYVIKSEGDLPVQTTLFVDRSDGTEQATYIEKNQVSEIEFPEHAFVLTMNKEDTSLQTLRERYPAGIATEFERFWMFRINTSNQ